MFHNNFQQMQPRPKISEVTVNPNPIVPSGNLESIIAANTQAVKDLADSMKTLPSAKQQTAFSKYPAIDLTTAHTDLAITVVRPVDFVQVWCDGVLDGMSIKIGSQSNPSLDFKQINAIRVTDNPETIYFTNDVRQGRSKAIIYFVGGDYPLNLSLGGQDILLAELAARGNSINFFDRRGEVVFMEDFENGLNRWDIALSGAGANVCLTPDSSLSGQLSAKIIPGSNVNHYAQLTRGIAFPRTASNIGIEAAWALGSNIEEAQALFDIYTGALVFHYGVRTIIATGETDVLTGPATWTQVNPGALAAPYANKRNYYQFKFVADLQTMLYKRFFFTAFDCPVTGLKGYAAVDASLAHAQLTANIIGVAGNNGDAYIDNVLITQNEPN